MVAAKRLAAVLTTAVATVAAVIHAAATDVLPLLQLRTLPIRTRLNQKLPRFRQHQLPIPLLGSLNLARWLVLALFAKPG